MDFDAKLTAFCNTLEAQMNEDTRRKYLILQENAIKAGRRGYNEIGIDQQGKRFVRVWTDNGTQRSVRYFVERKTGIIFGAKGWKAYNPNRQYGTLDTIEAWDWSGYYAVSRTGEDTLVPKAARR